ncbi:MAG: PQQ-binding-like beta-propeller repeat protein [Acidimicrobiales bacterium]|jgi:outer membrane protein assembly factor BamB
MHLLTSNRGTAFRRCWIPAPSGRLLVVAGAAGLALALTACSNSSAPAAATSTSQPEVTHPVTTVSVAVASGSAETLVTYHYGNDRQGFDAKDPSFRHVVVAWITNGSRISGDIYAEPLIYGGTVLVVTEQDDLYALKASTGAVDWKINVGKPAQSASVQGGPGLAGCGDIFPLGITGTPVIDAKTGVLYLAAEVQKAGTSAWTGVRHLMVAVRLSNHKVVWTRWIDPAHAGNGTHGTYIVAAEQERAALSLVNGRVYVEYGGLTGDCSIYHGYVVSLPESGKGALAVYETPSNREAGIWATSGAAADSKGDLFVATGNGGHGPGQSFDYGDAVVKLSPALKVLSYFAPGSWAYLSEADLDLGSDGPTLLPGEGLLFQSGKAGYDTGNGGAEQSWGYLLNPKALGGIGHPLFKGVVCPDAGFVFGANATAIVEVRAAARIVVFVPCPRGTVALEVKTGAHPSFSRIWEASRGNPNGPPIVAGGLVWAISTGADGGGGAANVLYGMNPATGRVLVTEGLAPVDHFVTPAAGEGEIVVGTTDGVEAFRP